MSTVKQNYDVEVAQIRDFLIREGWTEARRSKNLCFFVPPTNLRIDGDYSIALPIEDVSTGIDSFMIQAIAALEDIYGYRFFKLKESLATKSEFQGPAQFNVRFIDDATSSGSMPLSSIRNFLEQMHRSLYWGAKFRLDGSSDGPSRSLANQFSEDCRFLQTMRGSFIARIEVPFGWIRQDDLFDHQPTSTHDICSSVQSALEFITGRILGGNEPFDSDESTSEAITLFDPKFLESLAKLLVAPAMERVEISMHIGSQRRMSASGELNSERKDRLLAYVEFIRKYFYGDDDIDVTGSIVELRSRDPDGDKNHIRVLADHHGDRAYVSATLTNEQYADAVNAHTSKRSVRIVGAGVRTKTQVRVNRVRSFHVV